MSEDSGLGPLSRNPLDIDYPRALLVSLLVVLVLAIVVAASTSGAAFGAYNPAWDGAAELRGEADSLGVENDIALNTSRYESVQANQTVALVLSPDRPYTAQETARLRRFVEAGGTLVVAEDFGANSNALLEGVGASARFNGSIVRDERYTYQSPAMPVARNVSNHSLMTGVNRLTLNHGTVLEPNGARPIVHTSGFAYLDRNRNEQLDDTESLGTYPVVTVEQVGAGEVVAVSDPSLFINAMLERSGNGRFVRNLFEAHGFVLLDYSHAERLPPLALALVVVRGTPLLQVLVVGLGLVAVSLWSRGRFDGLGDPFDSDRGAVVEYDETDPERLRTYLKRQHPDWDEERIERVVTRIRSATDE